VRCRHDPPRSGVEARRGSLRKKAEQTYKGCKAYNDFREVLARKDIDAV
jgi:hypothetical protein